MPGNERRIVVVTGAAGAIGTLVRERLGTRWEIRAVDHRPAPGVVVGDVADPEVCRRAFRGADAVVHLAANPDPDASWNALCRPNVEAVHTVAAIAAECGVRRLVLASSLQATSAQPRGRQRRAHDAPRPANLYGATKAWAEAVGSWTAATSQTSVIALRIGYFRAEPPPAEADGTPESRSAWLSHNDCVRLIRAAVECDRTGFLVVNGVSANRHRIAEVGESEAAIGYVPRDDAWAPPPGHDDAV